MIIDPYTWHRLKIESITHASSDTVAVRLRRPDGYEFVPGQYAIVRTVGENKLMRQYSFVSRPDDDMLELLIQHEPDGEVSSWFVEHANVGDEVDVSQAFGHFMPDFASGKPIVMIAGRVGIAPFLCALRSHPSSTALLIYSVRDDSQICFSDELETYNVTIVNTGQSGRLDSEKLATHLSNDPEVYLCGSKQFVDAMTEYVKANHTPTTSIHRELFTLQ